MEETYLTGDQREDFKIIREMLGYLKKIENPKEFWKGYPTAERIISKPCSPLKEGRGEKTLLELLEELKQAKMDWMDKPGGAIQN